MLKNNCLYTPNTYAVSRTLISLFWKKYILNAINFLHLWQFPVHDLQKMCCINHKPLNVLCLFAILRTSPEENFKTFHFFRHISDDTALFYTGSDRDRPILYCISNENAWSLRLCALVLKVIPPSATKIISSSTCRHNFLGEKTWSTLNHPLGTIILIFLKKSRFTKYWLYYALLIYYLWTTPTTDSYFSFMKCLKRKFYILNYF